MAQSDLMYANTVDPDDEGLVTQGQHSRQNSYSNGHSLTSNHKENGVGIKKLTANSDLSSDTSSDSQVILRDGCDLLGESRTDLTQSSVYHNLEDLSVDHLQPLPQIPSRNLTKLSITTTGGSAKAKVAKSPFSTAPTTTIPAEEVTIPPDANISNYTVDQVANFLRCFKIDERIVSYLHNKSVDGKRFAKFKDTELESLGMKNSAIVFFRDKSNVKVKKKGKFML